MKRRPALLISLALAAGILASRLFSIESITAAAAISLLMACAGAIIVRPRLAAATSLAAVAAAGLFAVSCRESVFASSGLEAIVGAGVVRLGLRGEIMDSPSPRATGSEERNFAYRAMALLCVSEVETARGWRPARGRLRAAFRSEKPIRLGRGDFIQAFGTLRRIRGATNPGQFDSRAFWHRRGVDFIFSVKSVRNVRLLRRGRVAKIWRLIARLRARLRRGMEYGVPDCPERRIISAMILGFREGIDREVIESFRNTSTLHILAISGLHVGFICLLIGGVLMALRVRPRSRALLSVAIVAAYAVLTGARLPVVRASVMFATLAAAPLLGRRADPLNSLGVAACLLLGANPLQLFDAGFQLSFAAVLSIMLLAGPVASRLFLLWPCRPLPGQSLIRPVERWKWYLGRKTITLVSASLAAWAGLAPLIAYHFNIVAPVGLAANLIVIPSGFAIVAIGIPGAVVSLFSTSLASLINNLNCLVVSLMRWAVGFLEQVPYGWFRTSSPTPLVFACYYGLLAIAGLFLAGRVSRRLRAIFILASAVIAALPLVLTPASPRFAITFLDVGEGDSAFVEFPDGSTLLVDGGPGEPLSAGEFILKPFLASRGRSRIDAVVLTHPHLDHISGLFTVLTKFEVGRLIAADWEEESDVYRRLEEKAARRGVPIETVSRGEALAVGRCARILVLNPARMPQRGTRSDLNNNSIALLIECARVRVLLSADMEREAEEDLLTSGAAIRADVLKAGHHGGDSSSSERFLRRVSPRCAIISAGVNNRFGHPSPETMARLGAIGASIYRTDMHGAITVTSDGKGIDIETYR